MVLFFKINEQRTKLNVSITHLANLTGLSRTFLYDIESGKKKPSFETVVKIAIALKVDLNELYEVEQ